jgi:putative tricarboxylic transport membrane protein
MSIEVRLMRFNDAALGAIFLVGGISLAWYSFGLPSIPGQSYGAATFPLMIATGLILCSTKLLYSGILRSSEPLIYLPQEVKSPRALFGVAATILLVVFYILFSRRLGFIPSAMIVTFSMFLILKVHPVKAVVLAIVAAFACDFIFRTMLLVPLPFGIMPRLPW